MRSDDEAGRLYVKAEFARDLLACFSDDDLRAKGQDPDELRRLVREAGLDDDGPH
jgi:hypothetical protein